MQPLGKKLIGKPTHDGLLALSKLCYTIFHYGVYPSYSHEDDDDFEFN